MKPRFEFTNFFSDQEHLQTPGFEVTPTDILTREFQQMVDYCIQQYLTRPNIVGGCPQNYHFDSMPSLVVIQRIKDHVPDAKAEPMVLFNPRIIGRGEAQTDYEGCGSIFLTGKEESDTPFTPLIKNTTRPNYLMVNGLNRHAIPQTHQMDGFEAVAMDHEIEHTQGKTILDISHRLFSRHLKECIRTGNIPKAIANSLILYRNGDHFVIDYALDWVTLENNYVVPAPSRDCAIFDILDSANGPIWPKDFSLLEARYRVPYQDGELPIKVGPFLRDPTMAEAIRTLQIARS